ncbi:hypothetical protein EVAR_81578_1 [Eumeta japonica]|uniref:Uncharacterized protein n=1 Tax=Eumeta variegata TaxID=151549 RepID=A0A4C1V0Q6_EUMVA|nr:hypothetical protein EVAR_81578_1 [Eumeta japonica]
MTNCVRRSGPSREKILRYAAAPVGGGARGACVRGGPSVVIVRRSEAGTGIFESEGFDVDMAHYCDSVSVPDSGPDFNSDFGTAP